ncbi:MAG: lipopolysaccharide biosynthesis protein [Sulfitobacter sp.]|nr:lipopolysaccharide biosynthesis protein [Sulfitobacter sp.]
MLNVSLTVLLVRYLPVASFGQFSIGVATSQLISVPVSALEAPVLRLVANYDVGNQDGMPALVVRQIGLVAGGALSLSVLPAFLLFLLGPFESPLLWAACSAVGGAALGGCLSLQAMMRGQGRLALGQLPNEVVRPALSLAGAGLALAFGAPPLAVFAVTVASTLIAVVILLVAHASQTRTLHSHPPNAELPVPWKSYMWFVLGTAGTASQGRLEIVIGGHLLGPAAAAATAIGLRLVQLSVFGLSLGNFTYAPALAESLSRGDQRRSQALASRSLYVGLAFGTPLAVAMVISPQLLLTIFGSDYETYTGLIRLLGLAALVNLVAGPAKTVLAMSGNESTIATITLAAAFLSAVLMVATSGPLGSVAPGVAYAGGFLLWNIGFAVVVRRRVGIDTTPISGLVGWPRSETQ